MKVVKKGDGTVDREATLALVFKMLDSDKNGFLDLAEFKSAMDAEVGESKTAAYFAWMDAQGNSDGKLQLDEWVKCMIDTQDLNDDAEFEDDVKAWTTLKKK